MLLFASLLAILSIGFIRLESRLGILRDGLAPDTRAPAWQLPDADGHDRKSPGDSLQLLVFADHSLLEFPELPPALVEIDANQEAEILLLTKAPPHVVTDVTLGLGLTFPIIPVDARIYHSYNVRFLPFLIAVEPDGRVRKSGLVNSMAGVRVVLGPTAAETSILAGDRVIAT